MWAILTSSVSAFVALTLSHRVQARIKGVTAVLIAFGLLFAQVAPANPSSGQKWQAPPTAAVKKSPVAASQTSIAEGQKIYAKHCASCHGGSGEGDGSAAADLGIHPANLSESRSESDGALFWKITSGKKPMPGYGRKLSDADRWNVINYMRTLSGK